ncbi:phosphatase PAP2 family protein [Mycobacterium sp. 050134]|uniref:phosphatase PAP2 family protein n=1 Tax=Mycobacterium sp. 050134 TaxID=3096111 RepID=UPI002ED8F84B
MTRARSALTVSVAAVAVALYALMWLAYSRQWGWLHGVDWWLLNSAHAVGVKHPLWVDFWDGVSFALGPVPLRVLGMAAAVAALVRRNVRAALVLLVCGPLSGVVTTAAKGLANRTRPSTMLVPASSTSFPSGHALEATAGLLAILAFVLPLLSRTAGRVLAVAAAVCALAVGAARVALNVHHPSDVLAGWCLGYLYFLLCVLVFRPTWSRRGDTIEAKALLDP